MPIKKFVLFAVILAVCRRSKHINNRESNVMPNG